MSSGPGPIKPPPGAERRALREAEERARAVPVYKALVWAHEQQPPRSLTYGEIVVRAGLFHIGEAIDAVAWMRAHGVPIMVSPGQVPGEPAAVALSERLPEALEPTGP